MIMVLCKLQQYANQIVRIKEVICTEKNNIVTPIWWYFLKPYVVRVQSQYTLLYAIRKYF